MTVPDPGLSKAPSRLSLVIIFYNQEEFAEQAVRGALSQTYSPLEIVLSDDASTDNTFEVIKRAVSGYSGPHRVILNQNNENLGLVGHVNRVVELSTGEIIVLGGGDDIAMPNRVARSAEVLEAESGCMCVSFDTIPFEGADHPPGRKDQPRATHTRYTISDYASDSRFHLDGSSRAYRRTVFEHFGPIARDCPVEDTPLLLRCFLLGDVAAVHEPQVHYRMHAAGVSQGGSIHRLDRAAIHRQYLRDVAVAVDYGRLSDDEREQLVARLELEWEQKKLQNELYFASNRVSALRAIWGSRALSGPRKGRVLLWTFKKSWRRPSG